MQPGDLTKIDFVFLDRDGVLNRKPPDGSYILRADDFQLLPGAADAVAALNRSGRKVIVVTNQRCVALGLLSSDELASLHEEMKRQLSAAGAHLDAIYICPHDNCECNCRKPLTGLFEQAFVDFPDARAGNSVMLGDSLRDIESGHRLGMATVLVTGDAPDPATPNYQRAMSLSRLHTTSLAEFVHQLLCLEHR